MRTIESTPGRTIAARPRSRKSRGKACSASSVRRTMRSTAGGALPESAPSGTATRQISSTVQPATASETRPPASTRAATSRPNSSLPSGKVCESSAPETSPSATRVGRGCPCSTTSEASGFERDGGESPAVGQRDDVEAAAGAGEPGDGRIELAVG